LLGLKFEYSETEVDSRADDPQQRSTYMNGINYSDCVVNLYGSDIDLNEKLTVILTKIQDIIQSQPNIKSENFGAKLANELVKKAHQLNIEGKISELNQSLEAPENHFQHNEEAKRVISDAARILESNFQDPILILNPKYQKLEELLRQKKWGEADQETLKVMLGLSPDKDTYYSWTAYENIQLIPRRDLQLINKLWINHSNGRFGFSVQKQIYKEVRHKFNSYEIFGNRVGWYLEDKWIFCSDIDYSLKAPPGHLPALAMFDPDRFRGSNDYRFRLNERVFTVLMERQY